MSTASNPSVATLSRYAEAGAPAEPLPLLEALTRAWPDDRHFTQYQGDRRLAKATIEQQPMVLRVFAADYDTPNHEPIDDHLEAVAPLLERLPDGACAYFTANGFRVVTLLREPFIVDSQEAWERWRARHKGLRIKLDTILNGSSTGGWCADPTCDDPSRLFRLPNVVRDGRRSDCPEIVGTLGSLSWDPIPVEPRGATECHDGDASRTIVGECAIAAGAVLRAEGSKLVVTCPFSAEHSGGSSEAVVFATADGLGHFHCSHNHCASRRTNDALRAWGYDFGEADESEHEPTADEPRAPLTSGEKTAPGVGLLGGEALTVDDCNVPAAPRPWVYKELGIAPGRPVVLAGYGGRGKSWTLEALILSVASGVNLFGHGTIAQGPAVYISAEQDKAECLYRLRCLAMTHEVDLAALLRSGVLRVETFPRMTFKSPKLKAALIAGLKGTTFCGIDSLVAMSPGIDGNQDEISDGLRALAEVSAAAGCTCAVTAHANKTSLQVDSADSLEGALKGSASIFNAASTIWFFTTANDETTLWNTRCMVGPKREPLRLALDLSELGDLPGPARLRLEPKTQEGPEAKGEVSSAEWQPMFIEALTSVPGTRELKKGTLLDKVMPPARKRFTRVKDEALRKLAETALWELVGRGVIQHLPGRGSAPDRFSLPWEVRTALLFRQT